MGPDGGRVDNEQTGYSPAHRLGDALMRADELLARAAMRAAEVSRPPRQNPVQVAVRLRAAPRCRGAVVVGGALGAALACHRDAAYAFVRTVFSHVPFRSDVHPILVLLCARSGLLLEPRWVVSALSRSHVPVEQAADVLLAAIRWGYGARVALEIRRAFVDPLVDPPISEVALRRGWCPGADESGHSYSGHAHPIR